MEGWGFRVQEPESTHAILWVHVGPFGAIILAGFKRVPDLEYFLVNKGTHSLSY